MDIMKSWFSRCQQISQWNVVISYVTCLAATHPVVWMMQECPHAKLADFEFDSDQEYLEHRGHHSTCPSFICHYISPSLRHDVHCKREIRDDTSGELRVWRYSHSYVTDEHGPVSALNRSIRHRLMSTLENLDIEIYYCGWRMWLCQQIHLSTSSTYEGLERWLKMD